ncbi:MAG: hypothetical protein ACSLFF_02220 [Solirubrobacterales bacterium]
MAEKTIVVQLVWAPLGAEVPAGFVSSYAAHSAGRDHELVVLINGAESPEQLEAVRAPFAEIEHRELTTPASMLDLDAYRWVREQLAAEAEVIVFCGAHTKWLTDDWLQKLTSSFEDPAVGMAAVAGSFESLLDSVDRRRDRLLLAPRFAGFPNPHLRTNIFAFSPTMAERINWPISGRKTGAWQLENGRRSFYRQTVRARMRGVVVDADGKSWDEQDWPESKTFRSGAQQNALASDLRSVAYLAAAAEERNKLAALTWGSV